MPPDVQILFLLDKFTRTAAGTRAAAFHADHKAAVDIDSLLHCISNVLDQRRRQIEGLLAGIWIQLLALAALVLMLETTALAFWVSPVSAAGLLDS